MRDRQRRTYEMLARVRDFGAADAASFAAGSRGRELFDELNTVVAELDTHAEAQVSTHGTAVAGSTGRKAARERLRDQVEAISRTARAMDFETPGLADRFRLPRGNNDQSLLSTARSFHTSAAPLKAAFVRHELAAGFLEELEQSIGAFETAITGQNSGRTARVAATSAIDAATERGAALARQLDAVVRNKFQGDTAKLAAWESASRTERAPRARAEPTVTTPPPAEQ